MGYGHHGGMNTIIDMVKHNFIKLCFTMLMVFFIPSPPESVAYKTGTKCNRYRVHLVPFVHSQKHVKWMELMEVYEENEWRKHFPETEL